MKRLSADWVTAIATTVQTVAVIIGLAVAYSEFGMHRQDSEAQKKANTEKLRDELFAPGSASYDGIKAVYTTYMGVLCDKNPGSAFCLSNKPKISVEEFIDKIMVLGTVLNKVQQCVSDDVCDRVTAMKLFCPIVDEIVTGYESYGGTRELVFMEKNQVLELTKCTERVIT